MQGSELVRRIQSNRAAATSARGRIACAVAAIVIGCAVSSAAQPPPATAANTTALAKKQQNPISSMATIPWQMNFNSGGGLEDGTFLLMNVRPVMPFKVSDRWNMVTPWLRTRCGSWSSGSPRDGKTLAADAA